MLAFGAVLLLLASCRDRVTASELLAQVASDEGLRSVVEEGGYHYTCHYLPKEAMVAREALRSKKTSFPKGWADSVGRGYNTALYFELRVSAKDGRDLLQSGSNGLHDYVRRMTMLETGMASHAYGLTDRGDTVRLMANQYERTYGMSPDVRMLLLFPKSLLEDETPDIYVNTFPFTGTPGRVRFSYEAKELTKELPEIKELR